MGTTTIDSAALPYDTELLLGSDGEKLLRFMRAMFFDCATPEEIDASAQQAGMLGWVEVQDGQPGLTPRGWTIADSAREYCNWLDDGRELPVGLKPEEVKGRRVLDLGCGFGRYLLALQSSGADAIGVDLGEPYLRLSPLIAAREGQSTPLRTLATGESLPFRDASFDVVLCIRSLPYMDLRATLSEIARVLVDGGRLVLVIQPLSGLARHCASVATWRRSVRGGLRQVGKLANSVAYQWLGVRIIQRRFGKPTASPVYVTVRCLRRWMAAVGLTVTGVDRSSNRLIATRVPRR